MTILYGIKNCDSVKKARRWLDDAEQKYSFFDLRKDPLTPELIQYWLEQAGEKLINRRSTTWKQLSESDRDQAIHGDAIPLLLAHPTLIKRPVLEHNNTLAVGFTEANYASLFHL